MAEKKQSQAEKATAAKKAKTKGSTKRKSSPVSVKTPKREIKKTETQKS